ncbi:MAG: outer membrane protein assembly factor BamD [Holosporaceae bacterium]|jgi:outer membrane protein assembly factor BamD|nr:outer membrane protein assembly factor BamD [Holosporaceae bacterium]
MKRNSFLLLGCLLVFGCVPTKDEFKNRSVESVYKKANDLLKKKEYKEAASEFKDLETLFPYSSRANEGQVLSAYCHFLASEYMSALREIGIFLRYHPSHELVPYVLYLKAMCKYMQVVSVGRDQKTALDAKYVFIELTNRFPESKYYNDAMKRIMILDDIIAAHEMAIGRYYQKNKNALAALGRYAFVADRLMHTRYAKEAMFRIVECCRFLGLGKEAENAQRSLEAAFPDSPWTKKSALLMKK